MTVIDLKTFKEASISFPTVLCLGNFDGVHVGHRELVRETLAQAEAIRAKLPDVKSGAWFFRRAPLEIITGRSLPHLADLAQKLELFSELGLDYAFICDYEDIGSFSPEKFVDDVLKRDCGCVYAVCGFNFKFGKGAVGNAALLSLLMGQKVSVINEVKLGGETVSSSKIREHIAGGFIEKANALLGRSYSVKSPVIHGKKLGRTLGLPTINQSLDTEFATLKNGIYVSRVHVDGQIFPSVSNIGVRPSVESTASVNCETHIIGFDGDLYGKSVKVEFLKRLRDEIKFDGIDALKAQIQKDVEQTKEYFKI